MIDANTQNAGMANMHILKMRMVALLILELFAKPPPAKATNIKLTIARPRSKELARLTNHSFIYILEPLMAHRSKRSLFLSRIVLSNTRRFPWMSPASLASRMRHIRIASSDGLAARELQQYCEQ